MTSTAYPFTLPFLATLRAATWNRDGTVTTASGVVCRCYVDGTASPPQWALTPTLTEGAPIDATSFARLTETPHSQAWAFCYVTLDDGSHAATVRALEPEGGPPDPGYNS